MNGRGRGAISPIRCRRRVLPCRPRPARKRPNLIDRVRHAVRACHYSRRTEKPYAHWIKSYIFFHDTHED
jgi:hypothetical protein